MADGARTDGIAAGRLAPEDYHSGFSDLHPPLDLHEALVEADRCYFCYDAPCVNACPTSIDIPLFIRQIATGNPLGSAKTIFDQNIFGGMCARVCPTETLCEQACVREAAEGKPVRIGLLQRHATDRAMSEGKQFYRRGAPTGKSIAIIGAGPAGLACAHRLAMKGHSVEIFDARPKAGGLNEYGVAAYKTVDGFAQAEVDYIMAIGGITVHHDKALGRDMHLPDLTASYDAVFLAMGLGGVNDLDGADAEVLGSNDAVAWIAELRQAADLVANSRRQARRGDRRRNDRDRRGDAGQGLGRRRGDDLLSRTAGAHEGIALRTGTRSDARRVHPLPYAAEALDRRRWARHGDGVRPQRRDHHDRMRPNL